MKSPTISKSTSVSDNASTHKTEPIRRWLQRHPRFTFHFTPTYASWMNLVERWFAELTNKNIRRGTHRSQKELTDSINQWTEQWNQNPTPFTWHKTADEIFDAIAYYLQRHRLLSTTNTRIRTLAPIIHG